MVVRPRDATKTARVNGAARQRTLRLEDHAATLPVEGDGDEAGGGGGVGDSGVAADADREGDASVGRRTRGPVDHDAP